MRKAIVTGATKGIGLAIAKMLLEEGYFVTVTYAADDDSAEECARQLSLISGEYEVVKVDQADKEQIRGFIRDYKSDRGNVDCLVCNAGATLREQLSDIDDDAWERVMQINVNSNVYMIRDLFDAFSPNSRIVFIGSMMGIYPHGTSLAYGVSKAAVHALAVNLVKCFEGTGTTVNAIAPGFVETQWQKDKPDQIRKNICAKTALNRFASVEEVADAVRFCIKNQFVNGSIIEVSGGYNYK
jgi:3-oxoacyl-[acyl-carrier protein] reductase